jgi:hypothetical protein
MTLASLTVGELADRVARPEPTPGGGAVVAIVASLAASLAGMTGHYAIRRADACTATLLASAVASSTAILVGENLRKRPNDPRAAEAGRFAAQAARAAENVVAQFEHLKEVIGDGSGDH